MIFLVPYAYDRMPGGKPREGVPPNRLGSKARCDALVCAHKQLNPNDEWSGFILTAGYTKNFPSIPRETNESIAGQMRKYLLEQGFSSTVRILTWGTYKETESAIKEIRNTLYESWRNEPTMVYVSTNLGHMPRVWLCWFFLRPRGWKVHFVLANHSFSLKEYFQETAKFFQYLYRFVFKKW